MRSWQAPEGRRGAFHPAEVVPLLAAAVLAGVGVVTLIDDADVSLAQTTAARVTVASDNEPDVHAASSTATSRYLPRSVTPSLQGTTPTVGVGHPVPPVRTVPVAPPPLATLRAASADASPAPTTGASLPTIATTASPSPTTTTPPPTTPSGAPTTAASPTETTTPPPATETTPPPVTETTPPPVTGTTPPPATDTPVPPTQDAATTTAPPVDAP